MANQVKTPEHLKRAPVIGEDVLFYVNGDNRADPAVAKVIEVSGMNHSIVKLHLYGSLGLSGREVYNINDPILKKYPDYRTEGAWDFHPIFSQLVDAVMAPAPRSSKSDKSKESSSQQ